MVHTGKPSNGCGVCKRRRIKCDEKKPECSYCIKTKQKCPGYVNPFDSAWRDQTTVAQKNVERRQRARERARIEEDSQATVPNTQSIPFEPHSHLLGKVPLQLCDDNPEKHALNLFFTFYAAPPSSILERRAHFDFVEPLYLTASENSTMQLATLAVASVMLTAWMDRRADSTLARTYYLKAMSAMKEQLSQPNSTCADNEMLMAVLLLQFYENLIGTAQNRGAPNAHVKGAVAIIKHRGLHEFKDPISQGLLISARSQIIKESLRTSQPITPDLISWTSFVEPDTLTPSDALDTLSVRTANLTTSLASSSSTATDASNLLFEAHAIAKALKTWSTSLPPIYYPTTVTSPSCIPASISTSGNLYQSHCTIYPSIPVGVLFTRYHLSLIQTHLAILSLQTSNDNAVSRQAIQQALDDICASIPFFLGDRIKPGAIGDTKVRYPHREGEEVPAKHYKNAPAMGGYQLLGPLATLLGMKVEMRVGQREWIGSQMGRIARIYNIGR